ncbi:MAG: PEGA domain-containing protein [Nitrosomonadales bacterium]|nr:PEGA domain-containing protein [Nitrosomonadales bacterium]
MKQFLQRILLGIVVVSSAVGCSDMSMPSMGGIFGGEGGTAIRVKESKKTNPNAQLLKYAASIRINRYTDARKMGNPRKIGTGAENVSGMRGKDIILEQDVATMVTGAMKTRLDDAGFQVSEAQNGNALFELSGVVKELTYDVKNRDEVSISIETSLKDMSTGKVVWSGIVVEKNDRFAGVSGNNKNDVAMYLQKELGIVTEKTTEAISASLMVTRPELFNLTPGTKSIPGVTVLVAPTVANTPAPTLPAQQVAPIPTVNTVAPAQVYTPQATATSGLLLVNTSPARAKVYLDSVYYGLSPLRLEMEPGVHTISVKMEGYRMVSEKVSVRKGDSTEMDLSLER